VESALLVFEQREEWMDNEDLEGDCDLRLVVGPDVRDVGSRIPYNLGIASMVSLVLHGWNSTLVTPVNCIILTPIVFCFTLLSLTSLSIDSITSFVLLIY
jgi:hypothetical protein